MEARLMKNILLINPRYNMETLRVADDKQLDTKADNLPLGLATVAALTPDGINVDIWDEFVRPPIIDDTQLKKKYDLVGVTSSRVTMLRAREIGAFFRQRGVTVVIGGPGVSGSPDRCREYFDTLIIGEAELIWPKFVRDWQTGNYRAEYRQIEKPDILLSPLPKWESIVGDVKKYAMGGVQTTRGCPFDCEFCDVVFLNGRRQRHKTIERVLEEVRVLEQLGMSTVYFADDNLVGDHPYAKELLHALIPLNNSFDNPLKFSTQASIDASRDDKLMELLADANFYEMLVGIESPNKESLKEMGKFNNLKGDLVEEVHKILSYGISVRGALIGGLDHDDIDIFDRHFEFIQKSFLPSVSLHMLNAPIGTKLWRRLREEGRVIDIFKITDKVTRRIISNVLPKRMTRVELMQGFRSLYDRVFNWESFKERMFGFVSIINRRPNVQQAEVSIQELLKLGTTMNVSPEGCKAINEIFRYTEEKAPYMLGRVKELVVQFTKYSETARDLIPKLDQQIELESSGKLTFELDDRPLTVPAGFMKAYKSIFPDIHRHAYLGLTEKDKISEVLTRVFVDFLFREKDFIQLEDYHVSLLNKITDKVCAEFNENSRERHIIGETENITVPNVKRLRLGEDIIKSVEQELIKLVQAETEKQEIMN